MAEEVLGMSISLTPDQIRDLAGQINDTIRGLTDIQTILDATRDDLNRANRLKDRADGAKLVKSICCYFNIGKRIFPGKIYIFISEPIKTEDWV